MAHFGSAFQAGFNGATQGQNTLQQLQEQQRQADMIAMLPKILGQYAGGQTNPGTTGAVMQPPFAKPGGPMQAPFQGPTAPPPGGVSPPVGGAVPAVGAPGGAGPNSPMGGASAAPGSIDLQRLVQAAMGQGGDSGAQGYAILSTLKALTPQANNALKLDLGNMRNETQQRGQDMRSQTAHDIAEENIKARHDLTVYKAAISDKPTDQLLKEFTSLSNALRTAQQGTPEYDALYAKFNTIQEEIDNRRKGVGLPSKSKSEAPKGTAPKEVAAPSGFEGQPAIDPATKGPVPDGTIADDPSTGAAYIAKGGVWQNYK